MEARRFAELDSTSEEARRCADKGEEGPLWIIAERQTSGRGRRGRTWVSPPGNFMGTLLLRPQCHPRKASELSFLAAVAIHDAIHALLPPHLRPGLKLKWPNDLLHERRKLAGILLESSGVSGGELSWLSIGIGINLAHHPEGLDYPATSLASMGVGEVTPDDALASLDEAFTRYLHQWRTLDGFSSIRRAWLARAEGVGESVTVRLPDQIFEGKFEGLAEDGAAEVRLPSGELRLVSAGDVFFHVVTR